MLRQQVGTYGTSGYQNKQVSQPYASYGASNIQGPIPIASTGVSNIVDMGNKVSMKAIPNQRIVQQVPTTGASKINWKMILQILQTLNNNLVFIKLNLNFNPIF